MAYLVAICSNLPEYCRDPNIEGKNNKIKNLEQKNAELVQKNNELISKNKELKEKKEKDKSQNVCLTHLKIIKAQKTTITDLNQQLTIATNHSSHQQLQINSLMTRLNTASLELFMFVFYLICTFIRLPVQN
jgi:predicted nuclease with TOPRIM domain